jgi:hypothetical protein
MKTMTALIAACVLIILGLCIAEFAVTGDFDVVQVAISISFVLLAGVPYHFQKPARRKRK